jgi:MFS transporter, AAHS family, 4-hydroxybenzoate transporter
MNAQSATIEQLLAGRRIGGYQIFIAVLCGLAVLLDGISTQLIGYAAPTMGKALHLAHGQLGGAFAAGLVGLLVGGLCCSVLADIAGRRRLLIASVLVFGIFTVATGFAHDLNSLILWRFLAGLGLGGAMPIAITLTAEASPARARGSMVMMMFCGFPLGGALAGVFASFILPVWGWQALFFVGGALSLLVALLLIVALPESLVYLVNRGAPAIRTATLQSRLAPGSERIALVPSQAEDSHRRPVAGLFREGRALGTVLMWTIYFMSLLDIYFLASWLPTVLSGGGHSLQGSVIGTSMMQFGGVAGTLLLGRFLDRLDPYRVLLFSYLGATVFIGVIGYSSAGGMVLPVLFGAGFFLIGAQSGLSALASSFYPTSARATGVGWGLGIGRIGSIVGPVAGGILLGTHLDTQSMFLLVAVPTLLAAITVYVMGATRLRSSRPPAAHDGRSATGDDSWSRPAAIKE